MSGERNRVVPQVTLDSLRAKVHELETSLETVQLQRDEAIERLDRAHDAALEEAAKLAHRLGAEIAATRIRALKVTP